MTTRPSLGLSDWTSPNDTVAAAEWQAHVDAGRIGVRLDTRAANAAADAMARIVLGRARPAFCSDVASGSSTSGIAGPAFCSGVASGSSTSSAVSGGQ